MHFAYIFLLRRVDPLEGRAGFVSMWIIKTSMCATECLEQRVDIVFVVDASSSVGKANFEKAKSFISKVVSGLPIGQTSVRVALVRYDNAVDVISPFLDTLTAVTSSVSSMTYSGGGSTTYSGGGSTNTAVALRTAREQLLERREQKENVKDVVITITSGESNDFMNTKQEAAFLRNVWARLVWLYIYKESGAIHEEQDTMEAAGDSVMAVQSFDALPDDIVMQTILASCAGKYWTINVHTMDVCCGATHSDVYIILFGDKGMSGRLELDTPNNERELGSTDIHKFSTPDIGNLYKLRVIKDNSGENPDWRLVKVEVTERNGSTTFVFECHCWLKASDEQEASVDIIGTVNGISVCQTGKYSSQRDSDCSNCRYSSPCNPKVRWCDECCSDSFGGDQCAQDCLAGEYGQDCNQTCGNCNGGAVCNPVDGRCPSGCADGFSGYTCHQIDENASSVSLLAGAIAGSIVSFIAGFLLNVLISTFRRRRQHNKRPNGTGIPEFQQAESHQNLQEEGAVSRCTEYANTSPSSNLYETLNVSIDEQSVYAKLTTRGAGVVKSVP